MSATQVVKEIQALSNRGRAHDLQKFFQTAPGQYGEGDVFLGLTVPQVRTVAKEYKAISLNEIDLLIRSKFHEVRLCGLVILTPVSYTHLTLPTNREV